MNFKEVTFKFDPINPWAEILIAFLAEGNYDSFVELNDGLQAYIESELFDESFLDQVNKKISIELHWEVKDIEKVNWNAKWESEFEVVQIDNRCGVRASFHEPLDVEYEVIINPKMSFGTGHHATTYGMMEMMLDINFSGLKVLDMGCGTGVLAILSEQLGAVEILGIDIEEWAVENALENAQKNDCQYADFLLGDANSIQGDYHIVLANINKNILLNDLENYVAHLHKKGSVLLSGFHEIDLDDIKHKAKESNLIYQTHSVKNNWVTAHFKKK